VTATPDPRDLLANPRYELVPVKGVEGEVPHLPPGARVSITCSPKRGIDATLALSSTLAEGGFAVVPHISARLVRDEAEVEDIVARLHELGVGDLFVIGGDVARPAGAFHSCASLMPVLRRFGYEGLIGVAAYPESHPLVSSDELWDALAAKQEHAAYMVSQICFDADTVVSWLEEARARGVKLPLWVGFPGVVDRNKLMRVALRIGVGDSTRFLTKHGSLVSRLVKPGGYNPDELVAGLAPHVGTRSLGISGYHINTFNQVAGTERWRKGALQAMEEGARSNAARG
jgi:methylenetetrahydrofolate reductase (NADPH)